MVEGTTFLVGCWLHLISQCNFPHKRTYHLARDDPLRLETLIVDLHLQKNSLMDVDSMIP